MPYGGPFFIGTDIPFLRLRPDGAAYSVDGGSEVTSTDLAGGLGRYRRDKLGASNSVNVQYTCDPLRYQYLRSFFREACDMGSSPFVADLIFDTCDFQSYKCYFTDKTGFKLMSQAGLSYVVGATLEVVPVQQIDPSFDDSLVMLYGVYGECSPTVLNAFDVLVNSILVTSLG